MPLFAQRYKVAGIMYTIAFYGAVFPLLYRWIHIYHMQDWNAPVQSILRFAGYSGRLSILQFTILWLVQSFLSGFGFLIILFLLSDILKKKSTAVLTAAVLITVDFLMSILSFPGLFFLSLSSGWNLPGILRSIQDQEILWICMIKNLGLVIILYLIHRKVSA